MGEWGSGKVGKRASGKAGKGGPKGRAAVAMVRNDPFQTTNEHPLTRIAAVAAEVTRLKLKGPKARKIIAQGKASRRATPWVVW